MDAIMSGACGYLVKDSSIDELLAGIRAAANGESLISPAIAGEGARSSCRAGRLLARGGDALGADRPRDAGSAADRQRQDNAQIAAELHISPKTVKNHISNILMKLQIENRIQAAVFARPLRARLSRARQPAADRGIRQNPRLGMRRLALARPVLAFASASRPRRHGKPAEPSRPDRSRSRASSRPARRRWSSRSRAGASSSRATPTSRSSRPRTRSSRVTYAALVELGPSYRFPTEVLGEGDRSGSTWEGRLVLKGFGDPTLSSADLSRLANILWREGIRQRHRRRSSATRRPSTTSRRRPAGSPSFAGVESPPLSALIVDRGDRDGYLVADPPLAAAARFDQLLHARGIDRPGARPGTAGRGASCSRRSTRAPLSEIIEFMDHWSDNFTAEMVLKAIGAKAVGRGTTAAGAAWCAATSRDAGVPLDGRPHRRRLGALALGSRHRA